MSYLRPSLLSLIALAALACEAPPKPEAPPEPAPEPAMPELPPPTSSQLVPAGERGSFFTLPLDHAAFGELTKGDRVDILGTFPVSHKDHISGARRTGFTTMTLLQNVTVLDTFAPTGGMLTASLSLTTEEALLLETSIGRGTLAFLVRNPEDIEIKGVLRKTLKEVLLDLELIQEKRNKGHKRRKALAGAHAGSVAQPEGSSAIALGMRSVAIPLSLPTDAISTIRPGDRVDIFGRFEVNTVPPSPDKGYVSMTLLQNVKVLGVHPERGGLNLALTIEEAEMFAVSQTRGVLTAHLRNPEDVEIKGVYRKTLKEVLLDLELVQEKRMKRRKIRRKRVKRRGPSIIQGGGVRSYIPSRTPSLTPAPPTHAASTVANGFVETATDHLSTFGLDVDTGAFTLARSRLDNGHRPEPNAVRVEEFINYFDYTYPEPPPSQALGISVEAGPSTLNRDPNHVVMRVGVQARKPKAGARKPMHLTLLVDVSGSMSGSMSEVQRYLRLMVGKLSPKDTVAVATYAGATEILLRPTSSRAKIERAIASLTSGGGTAMEDGMKAAYQMASKSFVRGHENRVVVISDGDANIGAVSHDEILREIKRYATRGITMTTIGVGRGGYNDQMMEQLANKGNGNYYFIDSMNEAKRVFGKRLAGTFQVVAQDAKIQVEFDPAVVQRYRLIGYENRDIADKDFRNDARDAGEVGAGHQVTALYELVVDPTRLAGATSLATIRLRYKPPRSKASTPALEVAHTVAPADIKTTFPETSTDYRFVTALAAFAEVLRGSPYARDVDLRLLTNMISRNVGDDPDRKGLLSMIRKAATLFPQR